MRVPKFKVGDNVKLRAGYIRYFKQGTKVGEVLEFSGKYIRVKYDGRLCGFPYLPREIEHVVEVGQQLLFDFMNKE